MQFPETFLSGLTSADRDALLAKVGVRRYERGDLILRQGDRNADVAVLLTGRVKLVARAESGQPVVLGIRGAGELLGEIAAFAEGTRTADAVALEQTSAGFSTAETMQLFIASRPHVAVGFMRTMARRLREADLARIGLATNDARGRLADRLLDVARIYGTDVGSGVEFALPITQDELAGWVGVSRQAVARALGEMRSAGWLTNRGKHVVLHDLQALGDQASR